jgi:hypothetical protein
MARRRLCEGVEAGGLIDDLRSYNTSLRVEIKINITPKRS